MTVFRAHTELDCREYCLVEADRDLREDVDCKRRRADAYKHVKALDEGSDLDTEAVAA